MPAGRAASRAATGSSTRVLKAGVSAPQPIVTRSDRLKERKKWTLRPKYFRPPPRSLPRIPSVVREEWKSKTVWPQRERWHDVKILVRETSQCRLREHYEVSLADDLMYMQYVHPTKKPQPDPRVIRGWYDPDDPYTKNRINPVVGGDIMLRKRPMPVATPDNVVKLDKIILHTFQKEAIGSKSMLLGAIAAFRALSGESLHGGGRHTAEGIKIVRGRKTVGGWIRPGIPCGVKVELKGDKMYDFLGSLVECVLPRIRDFEGFEMDHQKKAITRPSAVAGVVSIGLNPSAMSLFPQIEVNADMYPKLFGMHITFVTNLKGLGAQNMVRALLSGYQLPFKKI